MTIVAQDQVTLSDSPQSLLRPALPELDIRPPFDEPVRRTPGRDGTPCEGTVHVAEPSDERQEEDDDFQVDKYEDHVSIWFDAPELTVNARLSEAQARRLAREILHQLDSA